MQLNSRINTPATNKTFFNTFIWRCFMLNQTPTAFAVISKPLVVGDGLDYMQMINQMRSFGNLAFGFYFRIALYIVCRILNYRVILEKLYMNVFHVLFYVWDDIMHLILIARMYAMSCMTVIYPVINVNFLSQRVCNVAFWCLFWFGRPEHTIEQITELPVTWDAMTKISHDYMN